jgi:hypothetical protein
MAVSNPRRFLIFIVAIIAVAVLIWLVVRPGHDHHGARPVTGPPAPSIAMHFKYPSAVQHLISVSDQAPEALITTASVSSAPTVIHSKHNQVNTKVNTKLFRSTEQQLIDRADHLSAIYVSNRLSSLQLGSTIYSFIPNHCTQSTKTIAASPSSFIQALLPTQVTTRFDTSQPGVITWQVPAASGQRPSETGRLVTNSQGELTAATITSIGSSAHITINYHPTLPLPKRPHHLCRNTSRNGGLAPPPA